MDTLSFPANTADSSGQVRPLGKLRTSLLAKVSLLIGLASLGLAILFALASTPSIRDYEAQRQLKLIDDLLSTVESTVRIACFAEDKTLATEVARGLMTNRSIAHIRITTGEEVLAEAGKAAASGDKPSQVHRPLFSPFSQNLQVGEIVLTADSDFIRARASDYSIFFAGLMLLEVIAITALVAFLILRTVVRPITLVSGELRRLDGRVDEALRVPMRNQHDEIGQLAAAFNRMIASIAALLHKAHAMREEMAHSELRFRTLAENSPDIIARYDTTFRLVFANPAYARETGIPLPQALANDADDAGQWRPSMPLEQYQARLGQVIATGSPDCMHWEWASASGEVVCHEMYVVAEYDADGDAVGALAIGRNISERKQIEQQLMLQATHDSLTGLPNRALLKDRLQHAITQSARSGRPLAVIFIDLDNFKDVNDSLGHDNGDELLKVVAKRMQAALRASDTIARLGGDEFVIFLEDRTSNQDMDAVVQKVFESIAQPCQIGEHRLYPGASLGIAVYPNDGKDVDTLMRNADTAMYVAKEEGRNHYRFFSPEMNEELHEWMELSGGLRRAIENNEFSLNYQPKARLDDGRFAGIEALIRWQHPERGWISPARFIPIAEKSGLINAIGHWVLNEACRQMRVWLDEGLDPGRVAVNLSANQCQGSHLPELIRDILELHQLAGERLEVEITETIVMADAEESIQAFWRLRELGVQVSVDDFGTGYSSLSYLKRLPVDKLKIDKSFVDDIESDANDVEIIRAIIAMAHSLNLEVIAEGVESSPQLECLRDAGCDQIQGYYYSRPLTAANLAKLLREGAQLALPARSVPENIGGVQQQ